jgi:hypothetical protein
MEQTTKIELVLEVCNKLLEIVKDPTQGGKEMAAEARNKARVDACDDIMTCINMLAGLAQQNEDYFEVVNIATKLSQTTI